jgi:hypothetical protein
MLAIALELAKEEAAHEDGASKFFCISCLHQAAINRMGGRGRSLHAARGYFDALKFEDGRILPTKACWFFGKYVGSDRDRRLDRSAVLWRLRSAPAGSTCIG